MDPSHTRRYKNFEIEVIVSTILSKEYPYGINIPVEIDLLAERNELVDDIVPIELLEDKFNVAAVLNYKPNGHFDILVDEDTLDYGRFRANFSIAHEFGHIVLHSKLFDNCKDIDDVVSLQKRVKKAYDQIERNANFFAGAILIPQRTIFEDAAKIYEALVEDIGYDGNLIPYKLYSTLATRYAVNVQPMKIRLEELGLKQKIGKALCFKSPYLET
ncbi:MAG: ImmA/IrrE family metallo-endopeptidase [Planctomycetes bacterium]|nr:ImmA/IrrE family metallo-endopeptidase [Planctomycetota bacterium]